MTADCAATAEHLGRGWDMLDSCLLPCQFSWVFTSVLLPQRGAVFFGDN